MRVKMLGAHARVTVSRAEVAAFRATWPCSTLPDQAVSFTFELRSGDLVDLEPYAVDGPDAVALSHQAQASIPQLEVAPPDPRSL
jgi:hypothetical protein